MPFDSLVLGGVLREAAERLTGSRVDKVLMPERDEVIFAMRGQGGAARLLVSVSGSLPRMQLTGEARENPAAPPMFCMLLRKHLGGARLLSLEQPGLERAAVLTFSAYNEFSEPCEKRLIAELMGRRSNIILVDDRGLVVDAIRRVDADMSPVRPVLPGLFYRPPPPQDKRDFVACSEAGFAALIEGAGDHEKPADRWLLDTFFGLSPLVARELVFRVCGEADCPLGRLSGYQRAKLALALAGLADIVRKNEQAPWALFERESGRMKDVSALEIRQYGAGTVGKSYVTFEALLDEFYGGRAAAERISRASDDMFRLISTAYDRQLRKIAAQKIELDRCADREKFRVMGELITGNIHQLGRGMASCRLANYYDEAGGELEIPLDPRLSPAQNAARYFKEYNKLKTAEQMLTAFLTEGEGELSYLESVLDELARAGSPAELREIRQELAGAGYLRQKREPGQGKKAPRRPLEAGEPMEFAVSDGFTVKVGHNNLQNDRLTLRTARGEDIFFHAKGPGSHAILFAGGRAPTDRAKTDAAMLAALYSKAGGSQSVPVDYTPVRNIKKPPGAKPGMVIYHRYETAYVTPDAARAEEMKAGSAR